MALTIIDPDVVTAIGDTYANYGTAVGLPSTFPGDLSKVTDSADQAAIFDTQHQKYTTIPLAEASQTTRIDNTQGTVTLTATPQLSYTYTNGYSTEHEKSSGLTVGVTTSFDFKPDGIGAGATLSASGSVSWTDSTGTDTTKAINSQASATVEVPPGKIFEITALIDQQSVTVPYTWAVHIDGALPYAATSGYTYQTAIGQSYFDVAKSPLVALPTLSGVDWNDFTPIFGTGTNPNVAYRLDYNLSGTLTVDGASQATIKQFDVTNGQSQAVQAEYDAAVPIGVHRTMDDSGREFGDTPYDDWVDGGSGDDIIRFSGGEDIAKAGAGDDTIGASGAGRSLIDGGDGNDSIRFQSTVANSYIVGGDGNDRLWVDAPAALIDGGAGDDYIRLNAATAAGTVITDAQGTNHVEIDTGGTPIGLEWVKGSDSLYILLNGGDTFDATRDVVWADFFSNADNSINGLTPGDIPLAIAASQPVQTAASDVLV